MNMMHRKPKTTSTSHKNSRVGLSTSIVPRSSFILITRACIPQAPYQQETTQISTQSSPCITICSLLFLATMQVCIAQNASWVKRKNRCMWLAKDLQAYAPRVVWKVFAQLSCLVCNTMDNKHERGCVFSDLCCHTNVNTYKQNNPIITKRN